MASLREKAKAAMISAQTNAIALKNSTGKLIDEKRTKSMSNTAVFPIWAHSVRPGAPAPKIITIEVTGEAGFVCAANLWVVVVIEGGVCEAEGVKVGFKLTRFQGEDVSDLSWTEVRDRAGAIEKPWSFEFSEPVGGLTPVLVWLQHYRTIPEKVCVYIEDKQVCSKKTEYFNAENQQAKRADRDKDESDTKVGGVLKLFEFDIKIMGHEAKINATHTFTKTTWHAQQLNKVGFITTTGPIGNLYKLDYNLTIEGVAVPQDDGRPSSGDYDSLVDRVSCSESRAKPGDESIVEYGIRVAGIHGGEDAVVWHRFSNIYKFDANLRSCFNKQELVGFPKPPPKSNKASGTGGGSDLLTSIRKKGIEEYMKKLLRIARCARSPFVLQFLTVYRDTMIAKTGGASPEPDAEPADAPVAEEAPVVVSSFEGADDDDDDDGL